MIHLSMLIAPVLFGIAAITSANIVLSDPVKRHEKKKLRIERKHMKKELRQERKLIKYEPK